MQRKRTSLAKTIRRLREDRHLTRSQFARALGVSVQLVSSWEAGRVRSLNDVTKGRIQAALNLSDGDMLELFIRGNRAWQYARRPEAPPDIVERAAHLQGSVEKQFWHRVRALLAAEETVSAAEVSAA